MTEPGYIAPASPGWWVRTNRVGINATAYDWATSVVGELFPVGSGAGSYGWAGVSTGKKSVEYISANISATNTVTIPTHLVGDIIVLFAHRSDTTTLPSKPAASGTVPAWVDIDAASGTDLNSSRTAYFVATATTTTSGAWLNAASTIAVVLRYQKASTPIGGNAATTNAATGQAVAPSITLTDTSGASRLLHFFGRKAEVAALSWSAAPAGYTQRVQTYGSSVPGACLDTKNDTTSDGSVTQACTANGSVGYAGSTVEILN